jgi:hypothetical protein
MLPLCCLELNKQIQTVNEKYLEQEAATTRFCFAAVSYFSPVLKKWIYKGNKEMRGEPDEYEFSRDDYFRNAP